MQNSIHANFTKASLRYYRGLLDEPVENIVDYMFKIGEKSINRISGRRFIESTVVPKKAVLEFSCHWTCAIDILVVTVEKATEEIRWLIDSCSPPRSGGEHVVVLQKLEEEVLKQRYCLRSRDIQELVY